MEIKHIFKDFTTSCNWVLCHVTLNFFPLEAEDPHPLSISWLMWLALTSGILTVVIRAEAQSVPVWLSLLSWALAIAKEKNFPPMTTASSLWAPTKQKPADLSPNYSKNQALDEQLEAEALTWAPADLWLVQTHEQEKINVPVPFSLRFLG